MLFGKGVVEVTVGDKIIGYKFGPLQGVHFERISGWSITEYWRRFSKGAGAAAILYWMMAARITYNKSKKIQEEVTELSVSDEMEAIGEVEILKIHNDSHGIPNVEAPTQTEGQQTTTTTESETTTKQP